MANERRRIWLAAGLVLALTLAVLLGGPRPDAGGPRLAETTGERSASPPARRAGLVGRKPAPDDGLESGPVAAADEGPSTRIAVVDDRGRTVVGATVQVRRPSFSMFGGGSVVEAEAEVGEGGFATVPLRGKQIDIPAPGAERPDGALPFVVFVEPPPDRPDLGWLLGADWPPAEAVLRLPPGGVIAGVVAGPDSRPLRDVVATVLVEGRAHRARTDPAGRFRVPHLPPGAHAVYLAAAGVHAGKGLASGRFPTGTTNAYLTLDVGAYLVVTLAEWEPGDGHELHVAPAVPVEGGTMRKVPVHAGVAIVYGLDEATSYTIYLPPGRTGRTAFAEAVFARVSAVELALEPAVKITGPIETPEGLAPSRVHVEAHLAGLRVPGTKRRRAGGTWHWVVEGLPDRGVDVTAWIGSRDEPAALGKVVLADASEASVRLRLVRVP